MVVVTMALAVAACSAGSGAPGAGQGPSTIDTVDPVVVPTTADSGLTTAPSEEQSVPLTRVVDGDTIEVLIHGNQERVRLLGMNTPEKDECRADLATARLTELLGDGPVRLVSGPTDRGDKGRLLRFVINSDGINVDIQLVREGLATIYSDGFPTSMDDELFTATDSAKADGVGIWSDSGCGAASQSAVHILEINYDSPGDDRYSLNEETLLLENPGSSDSDLTGWTLRDESSTHRFRFPDGFVLRAGATVTIHSGQGQPTITDLYWGMTDSAIWNNGGDTATLQDPAGNYHDQMGY